jgi:hypothetical protein
MNSVECDQDRRTCDKRLSKYWCSFHTGAERVQESNPDVVTDFAVRMGMPPEYQFHGGTRPNTGSANPETRSNQWGGTGQTCLARIRSSSRSCQHRC